MNALLRAVSTFRQVFVAFVFFIVAAPSQAQLSCNLAVPRTDPGTGFVPFGANEQFLARGGNAGPAWEWAIGTDTEGSQSIKGSLDWVSGRLYAWTLAYNGAGSATIEVRDQGALVLSRTWASGMDAGNALQFQVGTNPSIGPGTTIAASVSAINGFALTGAISQTGNNQAAEQNLYYFFPPMATGFTATGTVSLTYDTLPSGSRVQFLARAGNIACSGGNNAPTVSISVPGSGATFNTPANITVTANAADADGTVTQVQFFANGNPIGAVTSSPYTINWAGVAAGSYSLTARATDNAGAQTTSAAVPIAVNATPTVAITAPAAGASFNAPANITVTANAADTDGTVTQVQFYANGNPIGTATTSPYMIAWTGVGAGSYSLTAVATDSSGATTTSAAVAITVNAAVAQLYFIMSDHLGTPRQIHDDQQALRWRWDQAEPFGASPPDENPSGLGVFPFPLRFDGTYADVESGMLQNWHRELDPARGQYLQSDPLGVRAGLNTYAHLLSDPLSYTDAQGLLVQLLCRPVKALPVKSHCFVWVTCPQEGWDFTLSLFGHSPYINSTGYKRISTSRDPTNEDNPNSAAVNYRQAISPSAGACNADCAFEKSILNRFDQAPSTVPYGGFTNNSNTFAQDLITSGAFGTSLPSNVPPSAPGFTPMVGGRIR